MKWPEEKAKQSTATRAEVQNAWSLAEIFMLFLNL
jgi:hypothetical protein